MMKIKESLKEGFNNFKRDVLNFKFLFVDVVFKTTGMLVLILPFLYIYISWFGIQNFEPQSFRTVQVELDPKVTEVSMIRRPILNTNLVREWVTDSLLDVYNYTSTNYISKGQYVQQYFTQDYAPAFWESYTTKVEENIGTGVEIVDTIVDQKPIVAQEAVINGRRGWKFYVEMHQVYKSEVQSDGVSNRVRLLVTVMEQDARDNKKGIAIDDIKIR